MSPSAPSEIAGAPVVDDPQQIVDTNDFIVIDVSLAIEQQAILAPLVDGLKEILDIDLKIFVEISKALPKSSSLASAETANQLLDAESCVPK